jgi:phosphoribosylanthranilate isomerase
MIHPYIGVTGFMSSEEVSAVLQGLPTKSPRKLMVGVLASSKTIQRIPNKWPNRYPNPEDIAGIFVRHPAVLNLVHFHTKESERLLEQMVEVTELGGENFHGFQLNLKWPNPRTIEDYKERYPEKVLVLQCGGGALVEVGENPQSLADAAKMYEGVCEYLLIDPSGGHGTPFDSAKGLAFLQALNSSIRGMLFGIAGGLSPETLDLLEPIAEAFPGTSIDAEGRLRDYNDYLDVAKAKRFVALADAVFRQHKE